MASKDDKKGGSAKDTPKDGIDEVEDLDAEFAAFEAEAKAAAAKAAGMKVEAAAEAADEDIDEEDEFAAFEREAKEAAARAAGIKTDAAADTVDDIDDEEDEFAAFEREAKEAAAAAATRMGGAATGAAVAATSAAEEEDDEEDEFAAFEREAREAAAAAAGRMGGGASGGEAAASTSTTSSESASASTEAAATEEDVIEEQVEMDEAEIAAARKVAARKMAEIMAHGKGAKSQTIVVIGGGIAGITAAVEAAETGYDVVLLEKNATLGGRVTRLNRYFPKLCHPTCGLEINYQRIKKNPRIKLMTMSEATNVSGERGDYKVEVKSRPRYVNAKCTACGACAEAAESEVANEFNYGLDKVKSAWLPHEHAFPMRYVVAPEVIGTPEADKIKAACKYDAIDLDEEEKSFEINAGAIIWATGWRPYDAAKIEVYSYNDSPDIINNVEMERLANHDGPTKGKIVRPSDGQPVKKVAMIQCAGSRDKNHLPYCSMICCLASLKHAAYVREQYEDAEVDIYYIDIRAHDKMSSFYDRVKDDPKINFIKSKPGTIVVGEDGRPVVCGERTIEREIYRNSYDLVVLATGMQPSRSEGIASLDDLEKDEYGFVIPTLTDKGGQFSAGVASGPVDVALSTQSGTAAALKAIQAIRAS